MGRFFDKYELIIIIIIFVLFDLNGACREFIQHICFKNKKHTIAFFIVLGALLYDILLIHLVVDSTKSPPVQYKAEAKVDPNPNPNPNPHSHTCQTDMKDQQIQLEKKLSQINLVCEPDPTDTSFAISKKITMTFIVGVLIVIVVVCLLINQSSYPGIEINDFQTRLIRSSPLIIASIILIYVTYL